jgi:glycosyltransferase involved in cell wall biosynthesis
MPDSCAVICVTPVRNEARILDRFLTCASLWADHLIVADQGSSDDSRAIALRHPKATVIDNLSPAYDEEGRQKLLLQEARRRHPGKRLIVALDADEALTGNWAATGEWGQMLTAPVGTVFLFDWVNVLPDWRQAWIPADRVPYAFVDDGRAHAGSPIHSTRIPLDDHRPKVELTGIKVLHFQFTAWERMKSKQRWYQCWERINNPAKRPIQIYRQYHQMDAPPPSELHRLDPSWFAAYQERGIDFSDHDDGDHWHDREVLAWLRSYGTRQFARVDIWDVDWAAVARRAGEDVEAEALADPRSRWERMVHAWLARTQERSAQASVRWQQRLLIPFGW